MRTSLFILTAAVLILVLTSATVEISSDNFHTADFSGGFPTDDQSCLLCHTGNTPDVNITAVSQVCIECHDGVMTETLRHPYTGNDDTMRLDQHPIFIAYDTGASGSIKEPSSALEGGWENASIIADLLGNGKVLCTSCHNAHTGHLRSAQGFTALCFGCHSK